MLQNESSNCFDLVWFWFVFVFKQIGETIFQGVTEAKSNDSLVISSSVFQYLQPDGPLCHGEQVIIWQGGIALEAFRLSRKLRKTINLLFN